MGDSIAAALCPKSLQKKSPTGVGSYKRNRPQGGLLQTQYERVKATTVTPGLTRGPSVGSYQAHTSQGRGLFSL